MVTRSKPSREAFATSLRAFSDGIVPTTSTLIHNTVAEMTCSRRRKCFHFDCKNMIRNSAQVQRLREKLTARRLQSALNSLAARRQNFPGTTVNDEQGTETENVEEPGGRTREEEEKPRKKKKKKKKVKKRRLKQRHKN